jgi:hypothetical protein
LSGLSRELIRSIGKGCFVPKELKDKEEFQKLLESATEVRVARDGEQAKVKLRTKTGLFTFKTTSEDADALIKGIKAPVVEF